jgi:hypothetical protein
MSPIVFAFGDVPMLKDLVVTYANAKGTSASISMPRNDDQARLVRILGDEGQNWEIRHHDNGDRYYFSPNAPATGELRFRMDVTHYSLASTKASPPDADPGNRWLASDSLVFMNDPRMEAVSNRLQELTDTNGNVAHMTLSEQWAYARLAHNYPINNFDYTGISSNEGSAYAFEFERGDCTEFAAATVALLREVGINSKVIKTWWAGNDGVMGPVSYTTHDRYEFYLDDSDSDAAVGEGHWFLADNQLGKWPDTYGYGFGFGADNSINLGVNGDGNWLYSGLTSAKFSIEDV